MFILVYLRLYGHCLKMAAQGIAKNPWTLLLPIALRVTFSLLGGLMAPLGIVGGFLTMLGLDAVLSCYLYFTGGTVALQKMTLDELKKSFITYFWSVMGVFFVVWIANLVLGPFLGQSSRGQTISIALNLVALVILNPAPEVIYSKGTRGGIDTITSCIRFLQESWIEWFVPNMPIFGIAFLMWTRVFPQLTGVVDVAVTLLGGALFHFAMVFRGHLFQELDGSSHRQRMFRFRNSS